MTMSNRLDQKKQEKLQPIRMKYAIDSLEKLGYPVTIVDDTNIRFTLNGNIINVFPYSGWFQGKGIKPDRGIEKLIKQIKNINNESAN